MEQRRHTMIHRIESTPTWNRDIKEDTPPDLLVAMRTLMLPRGSNPSNWFISSSIVRWTSFELPSPSENLVPFIRIEVWGEGGRRRGRGGGGEGGKEEEREGEEGSRRGRGRRRKMKKYTALVDRTCNKHCSSVTTSAHIIHLQTC